MTILSRRQEALIRTLSSRHGRKDNELCLCDGLRSSSEILALRPELVEMIVLREGMSFPLTFPIPPVVLPEKEFQSLTSTVHSQGILVIAKRPAPVPLTNPLRDSFALVLDRVGDPGNFGTIIRTARAVGLHEIWLTKGTVDPFCDKCLRSASGAQFAVSIRMGDSLESLLDDLRSLGITRRYRTLPDAGENVFQTQALFEHTAIVLGCESTGVSEASESHGLNIPMPGSAESLNVAQAATVILFEYVRRMNFSI